MKNKGEKRKKIFVKCGVRTHAHFRVPELKSGALDRSANLTSVLKWTDPRNTNLG